MNEGQILHEIADRQAITNLIYLYCRSMDRMDRELGYSVWHDDATADFGAGGFQGSGRDMVDHACEMHAPLLAHSHQVANILIRLDGESAASETYFTVTLQTIKDEQRMQMSVWGRYLDRWAKREGRWGIIERLMVPDFDEIREVVPLGSASPARRDRTDPSYCFLGGGF